MATTKPIKRVAVLGAGTMGTGIATHVAGMGVKTLLLDMVPKDLSAAEKTQRAARNRFVLKSLQAAEKAKPPVIHNPEDLDLIEVGNFEDDLAKIAGCDWIVEVVVENVQAKQALYTEVEKHRTPGTIVTSNTSGLSIVELCAGRSPDFVKNFFVSHFFNPVRFMPLLELVPGTGTDRDVLARFAKFGSEVLGKGIVYGKDTPNFVANRIGVFAMMYVLHTFRERGLSLEQVDAVFGPVSGRPKSAIFRTADIVGIDVLVHVANNCFENLPKDEARNFFKVPEFVHEMVNRRWLGQKTKAGFYKKEGDQILGLDIASMTYKPTAKVRAASIGAARGIDEPGPRLKALLQGDDELARFAWEVTANTLIYAANRVGEICDDIVNCDRALRWGFNWELGPFETWDALGVPETVERMTKDKLPVPQWVTEMVARGQKSFYGGSATKPQYFDVRSKQSQPIALDPRQITIARLREENKVVEKNASATLYDMGDGILLFELNTKMNIVDPDAEDMLIRAVDVAESQGWQGMVVGTDHRTAFSAGANLFGLVVGINQKAWKEIEKMIVAFQTATMRLRYSDIPVVAAPAGLALGGGCEIVMGADAVRTHTDLYMGLVEVGVGLLPAAGGCVRMLERFCGQLPDDPGLDPLPFIKEAFKLIAMAQVSTGAHDARRLGMLRPHDAVTPNRDLLLHDAKQTALGMARAGYRQPRPRKFRLPGDNGAASLRWFVDNLRRGGQATDHDYTISSKVAWVLCGGDTSTRVKVDEQHILDLEREAFLSLCGEPKTLDRIQHMLTAKKPLRN